MRNYHFKYYDKPLTNAEFEDSPCNICGNEENCLSGVYLDTSEEYDSICLDCIEKGRLSIEFSPDIHTKIENELSRYNNNASNAELMIRKNNILSELSKNPPVPWIQGNEWPVCCGDFMKYIGEWTRSKFKNTSLNGDGKKYLLDHIDKETLDRIDDVSDVWDALGDEVAAFAFECLKCKKISIVLQDY